MQWFQMKEKSAGKKRLIVTLYAYKIFGKYMLYSIAFFVAFFTFILNRDLRFFSKKYLKIVNITPSLLNQFRQIFSYAISLADKIIMYLGKFNTENIIFDNEFDKKQLFNDIAKKNGVCFLFSHVGNIEVLQAFFQNQKYFPDLGINVFLNKKQTKIFNDFIESIKINIPVKNIISETFDISDVIKLKENLEKGEVVFLAGDRISEFNSSKTITTTMFGHQINLPEGSFKLAKLCEIPIYFISAIRQKNGKYKIYVKQIRAENIAQDYTKYMETIIKNNPFQFYHFYDFFC